MRAYKRKSSCVGFVAILISYASLNANTLEEALLSEDLVLLTKSVQENGDATRGAIIFYQAYMSCAKCHVSENAEPQLGPKLSEVGKDTAKTKLLEAVLQPSKEIKKGYQTARLITEEGKTIVGLFVQETDSDLVIRDPSSGRIQTIPKKNIDEWNEDKTSIMPEGLVNQLTSRQQFLDLGRYLFEIADGGVKREAELKPPASLYVSMIPEYEKSIDHAAMIADLNDDSFERGAAIYNRLCINCHGNVEQTGSLPTSLRFASGKFKNGSDPHRMYETLTKGYGMMVAQAWMVPEQKYDVIHYIRESYLKPHNASEYFKVTDSYLASLPKGDSRGPAPSNIEPWSQMDYGPRLVNTYEVGKDGSNFAYKGIAVRLDAGPGGVSRGNFWSIFDHDTMRVAAAWQGEGFIDWNGIHFNGRHGSHPRIVGTVQLQNKTGPGWARPGTDDFEDNRLVGRDKRRYGPLDRSWAQYKGLYRFQDQSIVSYTVGDTPVLESHSLQNIDDLSIFKRTLEMGKRTVVQTVQVAKLPKGAEIIRDFRYNDQVSAILFGLKPAAKEKTHDTASAFSFDGAKYLVVKDPKFDTASIDYAVSFRMKTDRDGSIFTHSNATGPWVANGKTLFVQDGRLTLDIGWVGAVRSNRRVADNKWHDVVLNWRARDGRVEFFIDGEKDKSAHLQPKEKLEGASILIGYTSPNFPFDDGDRFVGELQDLRLYQRRLSVEEITSKETKSSDSLVGHWDFQSFKDLSLVDLSKNQAMAQIVVGEPVEVNRETRLLAVAIAGDIRNAKWLTGENSELRLRLPVGESIRFHLQHAVMENVDDFERFTAAAVDNRQPVNLTERTKGGPAKYPEILKTQPIIGSDDGPFAVDILTHPENNPWFCRVRLTGIDYFDGGDEAILSAWDGDIWRVAGLNSPENGLTWRRIADGLFQPLGVRIIDNEKIFVTCRDQLVLLKDLNGDGEIDFYQCFNNDHQVTEHFHEFAMGLQTDDEGNFYYAKSARHALKALVPHHGTLLRISKDGTKTDILARGFRAANGVCLNPDGSFIVTDQEGHWNPKNRINWVREGGFYGNMWGYHDVTDSSDSAMEQPLCWITNEFDRSPSELLWCTSKAWGPLNGTLLNFSYGYGKVFVVPHEELNGQVQGGMCRIDIPQFPTGVMRGRFHPTNGQLYCCGMFAWAGTQQQPGGFYRIRYTGKPVQLPIGLHALSRGVRIDFSGELDRVSATNAENYQVKVWEIKRTGDYGSDHYHEHQIKVTAASLATDGKSVTLEIPEIQPTWCMEIKYNIRAVDGQPVKNAIHNTIHNLPKES